MKYLEWEAEPLDNARLANLCGVLDENLRQIESAFDVTIARRSGHFTLAGAPAQRGRPRAGAGRARSPCATPLPLTTPHWPSPLPASPSRAYLGLWRLPTV